MKKFIFILPALAMLTLASCHKSKSFGESDAEETVNVAHPIIETITLSNEYPGYLTANSSIDVMATVSGHVLNKTFDKGTLVQKGQTLITIDPVPYRDAVEQAEAALATALSSRDYAEEHYAAVKKALESDAVSKMEVIQAESAYKQSEADIKNARAALETARRNLAFCNVTAPITGVVSSSPFSVGDYVNGSGAPVQICTIYDNTSVSAQFAIEDSRYLDIINSKDHRDSLDFQHVPVRFDEELPHKYTGYVEYVAPALNTNTGTLNVSLKIQNPYDELREGMYVKVDLPYARQKDAVLVRDASIGSDQLGKYLYVVGDSGKVVYTPVELGPLYHDSLRVINKGIDPGQIYVTQAMLKVRDGMKVKTRLTK